MRFNIGKKLMIGFLSVALLLGITSTISFISLKKVDTSYSDIVERRVSIIKNVKSMQVHAARENSGLRSLPLQESGAEDLISEAVKGLEEEIKDTEELVRSTHQKQLLKNLTDMNTEFKDKSKNVVALLEYNVEGAKVFAENEVMPLATEIRALAEEIEQIQENELADANESNTSLVNGTITLVLLLSIVSFVLALGIGYLISKMISKPMVQMAKAAEKIAAGDLTSDVVVVKNQDEIGELANSFNIMTDNLRKLIVQVTNSVEHVAASSEELTASAEQTSKATEQIANTIQEVAVGSENQVQSVEESSKAIRELSVGIEQIASSATEASHSTELATGQAIEGNQDIQTVINQMNSINEAIIDLNHSIGNLGNRSKEIGHIIEVISQIADQTNLLALNAAIEAARAGDHGRGFAVVADEVRKLAEQSSKSSMQISELISFIQEETEHAVSTMETVKQETVSGIELVNKAGVTFETIQVGISSVNNQIQEVSTASEQMAAGAEQVLKSIESVVSVAEQSAAGTQTVSAAAEEQLASMEEITSSSASLSKMAEELSEQVGKFRVN